MGRMGSIGFSTTLINQKFQDKRHSGMLHVLGDLNDFQMIPPSSIGKEGSEFQFLEGCLFVCFKIMTIVSLFHLCICVCI